MTYRDVKSSRVTTPIKCRACGRLVRVVFSKTLVSRMEVPSADEVAMVGVCGCPWVAWDIQDIPASEERPTRRFTIEPPEVDT